MTQHVLISRTRAARLLTLAAVGAAVLATATACSGAKSGAAAPTPSGAPAAGTGANATGRQSVPGTFGIAAAVAAGRFEVQDPSTGQTTVTYTSTTSFTQQKSVTEAAVKSGECVSAVSTPTSAGSSGAPASPTASRTPGAPTTITATTITITQPVSGSCSPGGGRAGGFGTGTARPSGAPTGSRPSGTTARGGSAGFGGLVSGKVTSVSGTTIAVQAIDRSAQGAGQTIDDTVLVTSATRYLETAPATSAAVQVGVCVQAIGPADATGAVAATRIGVSPAVNGSCVTGFGGRGGFGRPGSGESTATGG